MHKHIFYYIRILNFFVRMFLLFVKMYQLVFPMFLIWISCLVNYFCFISPTDTLYSAAWPLLVNKPNAEKIPVISNVNPSTSRNNSNINPCTNRNKQGIISNVKFNSDVETITNGDSSVNHINSWVGRNYPTFTVKKDDMGAQKYQSFLMTRNTLSNPTDNSTLFTKDQKYNK